MSSLKITPDPTIEKEPSPPLDDCPFDAGESYTIAELCHKLKICTQTFYNREKDGRLPPAVRYQGIGVRMPGGRMVHWWMKHTPETYGDHDER